SWLGITARLVFLVALLMPSSRAQTSMANPEPGAIPKDPDQSGYIGNEACARCHSAIYQSYRQTAMAQASGPAIDALTPAEFTHKESGVHYRIYSEKGSAWLSFDRPGDPAVQGKRELLYFIGSGRRGRSYLFDTDGLLFESPVNWYANKRLWDMAPAYQTAKEMPLNLPAYASCLHCHVSGMRPPAKDTDNRYPSPPFLHNGVSCERCHGPGAGHANGGPIVNPAELNPARRDEVCMQCHLEGKVAIERPGRHAYEFRPGNELFDYVRYFVLSDSQAANLGAVSQVEALAQSECKKKSGNAMSCTSCHNPHQSPAPAERVAYYRGKCLACHGTVFAAKHHAGQPDCLTCHMPAAASSDVAHTQVTDHRILRRPQTDPGLLQDATNESSLPRLVPFPPTGNDESDLRDLALAWESLVESGMTMAESQAKSLLSKALKQSPEDPALLSDLGYIEQKHGATENARKLYQKALAVDPDLVDAATNLAVIEARAGNTENAIALWQKAFDHAPARSSIGLNLARAYCNEGKVAEARTSTLRVLEFNPDLTAAKQMLRYVGQTPSKCKE
ncbi:MAG: tetratricopeptide repeat protein, partial [Candidatus Sulfotelmatobacter sp.]